MPTLENFWKNLKEERQYALKKAVTKPQYLISDKFMDVEVGMCYKISVKTENIPPHCTVHLSLYAVNPLGSIVGVGEKMPKPMGLDRSIEHVMFTASENGRVKRGDLLGYFFSIPFAYETPKLK